MMDETKIKDGEIFWTCRCSMETENYSDFVPPHRPYRVKIGHLSTGAIVGYQLSLDGMSYDDDPNAMALLLPDDVFGTREEALVEYQHLMSFYISDLKDRLAVAEETLAIEMAVSRQLPTPEGSKLPE